MKTPDIQIETGKASQILPSFIRSLCRSRFEYDVPELQEEHKEIAARTLEKSPIFSRYNFPAEHVEILRGTALSEFHALINQKLGITHTVGCSYQRELRKRACWSCPVTRAVMKALEGNEDGSDHENDA